MINLLPKIARIYFICALSYFLLSYGPKLLGNSLVNDFGLIVLFVIIPAVLLDFGKDLPPPDTLDDIEG